MDWDKIIARFYRPSIRSTAEAIVAKMPEIGRPETIRKRKDFIDAWNRHLSGIEEPSELNEFLDFKCQQFLKKKRKIENESIITVAAGSKPVAIVHFGDPHLDDPGCDLPLLREQIKLIENTPGVWGGNIGDTINNWVGKLAKLYAKQSVTFEESLMLAEWFAQSVPWLYWVLGNHDHWDNGSHIIKLLLRGSEIKTIAAHDAKINLQFDNGVQIRIRARHNWKGRSIYDPVHGIKRSHFFGDRWADFAIGGHTHEWALWQGETEDGIPRWAAKVRGYKLFDEFAEEKGLYQHRYGAALLTIINPYAPPTERIQCFWDVHFGLQLFKQQTRG